MLEGGNNMVGSQATPIRIEHFECGNMFGTNHM